MKHEDIRVRFAPSPTGMMHLGNVRTALLNYLFAIKNNGTFVLRIEDTDPERIFDPGAKQIFQDLAWLGLDYNEGGNKGGPYAPYFQSQRDEIYKKKLAILQEKDFVYRCFCTQDLLQKKRERQIALKQPPRYDRTCAQLTQQDIDKNLAENKPFIWRFKINKEKKITISDLARGSVTFDLKNFSDFPLTRENGSFTFIFSNAVDDIAMKMSHVFRGEDHLSNTANQASIYDAFGATLPVFWHMPILCNKEGKKLSKRDFGFSLRDLKNAGFLPEAICNYLGIIGGSFEKEIMNKQELAQAINFDTLHTAGTIKYDVEKLTWVNHKWIEQYDSAQLVDATLPFITSKHPQASSLDKAKLENLLSITKSEMSTLADAPKAVTFYFEDPKIDKNALLEFLEEKEIQTIHGFVKEHISLIKDAKSFVDTLKEEAKKHDIALKKLFMYLRLTITGDRKGPQIIDILNLLGPEESAKRLTEI